MADDLLRFATFLAPNMFGVYRFAADYVGERLGYRVELIVGSSFDQFAAGQADVGFVCGLPYVQLARQPSPPVELVFFVGRVRPAFPLCTCHLFSFFAENL